ncbi:RcnB family protein [Mesorhizobium sp. ANAO-SY3R2]|uniref:RcnB family protein n=1 Tax=Mesorhizobium sp. ANAO-SY3R2 TaxID=3166644 RepID=UPI00366E25AF
MKRVILAAVAFSMFAVPMAQAQQRHDAPRWQQQQQPHYGQKQHGRDQYNQHKKKHHWSKGERVPDWRRKQALRDYHRYGLKRPGHGQRWVKVDNDFLLISMASGIIAAAVAGR